MIELEGVGRSYGGVAAVRDVSLRVARGEMLALIGPSGCGKSTTLRMINRLVEPTAGRIRVNGEPIEAVPPDALRRRIGYVIQNGGLFPHWTVERNIATVPALLRWPRARIRDRVAELLALLHLPERLRTALPHQLSGGQQQRVGVARALAADPDVLLMDEPFGAVDPLTRAALQASLQRIHRDTGKTIVLVTHDMDEALRLAQRIAVMHEGTLAQAGTPAEILGTPADDFVRRFVGSEELGLRLLAVEPVRARMRAGEAPPGAAVIPADADLRRALSDMLSRGAELLAVTEHGRTVGTLALRDVLRR